MIPTIRERKWTSLRQRLLNIAHEEHIDYQSVLTRFGLERFLYRLGKSEHRDALILKNPCLFDSWHKDAARPVQDLDFLGRRVSDIAELKTMIADIANCQVENDELEFDSDNIQAKTIRKASSENRIAIKIIGKIGRTKIPLRIDIGSENVGGFNATATEFPTLLGQEYPDVLVMMRHFEPAIRSV